MKIIIPFVLLLVVVVSAAGQKKHPIPLNRDTTLTLWYGAIGCTCAQWGDLQQYYYLVPANDQLMRADTLWDGESFPLKVQVTGKLISYAGVPEKYVSGKSRPDPGNVFRYSRIRLLYKGKPIARQGLEKKQD